MPVMHIKESVNKTITTDGLGFCWMTKRINLPEQSRFDMLSVDVFNDNGLLPFKDATATEDAAAYQLYVSPYPMALMSSTWGYGATNGTFQRSGQPAAEHTVLYKEIGITQNTDAFPTISSDNISITKFPNDAVSSVETQQWFSPHVYVTIFIWNAPESTVEVDFSLYMRINKVKASAVSSAMGRYSEFLDSQIKRRLDLGVTLDVGDIEGYYYPMWRYGGIRPERMITGALALRYYNKAASNESQNMSARGVYEANFKNATTMVRFDEPFGKANLPEWITMMDVAGITAGPIRQYPPPVKFFDNGNTMML
jgi:hypothetical protein